MPKLGKLFGVDPDKAGSAELLTALDKLRSERAETVGKIAALTADRTSALLSSDDAAVTTAEAALDQAHRALERCDLLIGEVEPRIEVARLREEAEKDRRTREQTSAKLNKMAAEFVRDAPQFKTALERFRAVACVSEALGDVIGTVAATDALIRLVEEPDVIVSGLQARAEKVLTGTGPATFVGL